MDGVLRGLSCAAEGLPGAPACSPPPEILPLPAALRPSRGASDGGAAAPNRASHLPNRASSALPPSASIGCSGLEQPAAGCDAALKRGGVGPAAPPPPPAPAPWGRADATGRTRRGDGSFCCILRPLPSGRSYVRSVWATAGDRSVWATAGDRSVWATAGDRSVWATAGERSVWATAGDRSVWATAGDRSVWATAGEPASSD
eukprot:gene2241-7057_t